MSSKTQAILDKYWETIAEEVNVKKVTVLGDDVVVTANYIPLWQKLWWQFWKDTARIIAAAKEWNALLHNDWTLLVTDGPIQWLLTSDMYETRWSGLEEDHQTVEWWVIVSLDFTITDELKKEWIARELSRFLNQMRKDAGLQIDQKIVCRWSVDSENSELKQVISTFYDLLMQEALLLSLNEWRCNNSYRISIDWGISCVYATDIWYITFEFSTQ
jgi:isoleucyl-tRNA synthetase